METSSGEIKNMQSGVLQICTFNIQLVTPQGPEVNDLPRSPAASHRRAPSVTPGMGAKVADTKVAMPRSVSEFVSSSRAGVGGERGDGSSGGAAVTSG